jgi:hypothetical protein
VAVTTNPQRRLPTVLEHLGLPQAPPLPPTDLHALRAAEDVLILGLTFLSVGVLIGLRFLYGYWLGSGPRPCAVSHSRGRSLIVGVQVILIGLIGDTIAANRRLTEEILYLQRSGRPSRALSSGEGR